MNIRLMFFGKKNNTNVKAQPHTLIDINDVQLVDYIEGNTWIDSDILDPPLPSGLAHKSQRFPSFANNKYLQMFLEAITEDIRTKEWEKNTTHYGQSHAK